jgi:hypothetical protein
LRALPHIALASLCLCACGFVEPAPHDAGDASAPDAGTSADAGTQTFIALDSDFAGFQQWTHFDENSPVTNDAHVSGPRTIYVNKLPPHGSTRFPVGTIIVKTLSDGKIFAMSKRGGDFNDQGAVGWEWFELVLFRNEPVISWQGIAPDGTDPYGLTSGGSCNACHGTAAANDYVQDPDLQLAKF